MMLDATSQHVDDEADAAQPFVISADKLRALGGEGAGWRRRAIRKVRTWLHNQPKVFRVSGPTGQPKGVRVATRDDEKAILDLLLLDVKENALDIALPSPDAIIERIQACTRNRRGLIGVIEEHGKIVACISLEFFQWWWSRAYFIQEVNKYVHPDHRKSSYADDLGKFARWAADDMTRGFGYQVWLLTGVTSKTDIDRKVAHYARHGNYIGSFFIYPDPWKEPSP